jgi:cell division protein WhiA
MTPPGLLAPFAWETAADHCRLAYLRGRFLAHGSLSLAAGRMHLEFVVPLDEAETLAHRFGALGLPAGARARRGRGVVTWKNAEAIVTFLRRVGASASVLELETRLVTRSLRGHLNRVINAETANLQRSVATATRQIAAIETLEQTGRLATLPASRRAVARLRRDAPEATFSELAERLGTSRGLVQRALIELESAALAAESGPEAR